MLVVLKEKGEKEMIKFTFDKNDKVFSDGRFCSNGHWICDLQKIPLGELLMDNIDIVCGTGNQMKLIDNNPIQQRDFTNVIPEVGVYEMRNSGFIFENPVNKCKYRLFMNVEQGLLSFVNENYIKIFNDVKTESITVNGQGEMLQFRDKGEEFVFGIMPMNLEAEVDSIFELISKARVKHMWEISNTLNDCIDEQNSEEDANDEKGSEE